MNTLFPLHSDVRRDESLGQTDLDLIVGHVEGVVVVRECSFLNEPLRGRALQRWCRK